MVTFPCRNCPNRKVGCHATCEMYNDAKSKKEELHKLLDNERLLYTNRMPRIYKPEYRRKEYRK